MSVGTAIRLVRTARQMSQKELARRVDCSAGYLSMIENDKKNPSLKTLEQIAVGLDVPVSFLLDMGSEHKNVQAPEVRDTLSRIHDLLHSLQSLYRQAEA